MVRQMVLATRLAREKKPFRHFRQELIGKTILVVNSANPSQFGLKGKVVDETQSTIKIGSAGKIKTLFKRNIQFKIETEPGKFGHTIGGKDLAKRPEERIKN